MRFLPARSRNSVGRRLTVASISTLLAIGLVACGGGGHTVLGTQAIEATLSGGNEVPAVDSPGSGAADFVTNHSLNTIGFDVRLHGLDGITGVQVQVGDPGTNGPVIFTLSTSSSDSPKGLLGSDDLTPDPNDGINSIDDAINAMLDGRTYVNVLTQAHLEGEIRGQIEQQ